MPEGDTVRKIADYLEPLLRGRSIRRLRMADQAGAQRCTGRRVDAVFAHGKHLFVALDDDLLLRSHLGMYGDWHRYRPGEAWRRPRWQASLELATDEDVFVCFNAKEIELVAAPSVRERILAMRLGPDLIGADVDLPQVVRRAREFLVGDTMLADVLLDQRIAAGIGNVYKSEVLFIEALLPQTRLDAVDDVALTTCFATAADLLRRNLGGGPRVTRFVNDGRGRLWVYGRRDKPCLRCDRRIVSARMGRDHRGTYWCRDCQT